MKEILRGKGSFTRLLLSCTLIILALLAVFYWIVADNWRVSDVKTDAVNADVSLAAMDGETEISQSFPVEAEMLDRLELTATLMPGWEEAELTAIVSGGEPATVEKRLTRENIGEDGTVVVDLGGEPIRAKGKTLTLTLKGTGALSFWRGVTRSAGKFDLQTENIGELRLNGESVDGSLVFSLRGRNTLPYTAWYWPAALVLLGLGVLIAVISHRNTLKGRPNIISRSVMLCGQYEFLLKTLVTRDFRVKYKASALGLIWSFLNPMLMTLVYLFVFSTIFQSSIEHFPVYLMSGIVVFNYFADASNLGMGSIVGNAGLITKVYMPKYIFPVSKVLSSAINLVISMIPLLLLMVITGVPFHKSLLLLPVLVVFLVTFCVGVSLILSSCMVFFRDIQFLWSVLLTILNFLSPIFYPESIIPSSFRVLYHCNPLYQFLFFGRSIIIGGVSPTPQTYLYCTVAALGTLLAGVLIFRKSQNRFVLYL